MMDSISYTLFDTPIGRCAIAWGDAGIVGLFLPEASPEKMRSRIRRRFPEAREDVPSPPVADAAGRIVALLSGAAADLSDVALDMRRIGPFERSVYAVARAIRPGETLTYGDIAARLGDKALSREVGQALGANPFPIVVPCHRVVAANGRLGGFSAPGGAATKQKMLAIEGAAIGGQADLF